jgi:hypothetical protein
MKSKKAVKIGNGVLLGVVIIALLIFGIFQFGLPENVNQKKDIKGVNCNTAPTLTLNVLDALNMGTVVSPMTNNNTRLNGEYVGTAIPSTLAGGDEVQLLVTKAGYFGTILPAQKLKCEGNIVNGKVYSYGSATVKIFNDEGNVLTDSATIGAGAVNQSASASNIVTRINMVGQPDKSTGNMLVVVESTNTTQTKEIVVSGNGVSKASVPSFYTVAGAGSVADAYTIPALKDGASTDLYLQLSPESGQTLGATDGNQSVYVTFYALQDSVDADGTFLRDAWQNSQGTNKTLADFDYDFVIAGSL